MTKAKEGKPPPGRFVLFLTDKLKLGAPLRLAPSPELPRSKERKTTSKLRYAARFPTRAEAKKYLKFYAHPGYTCTVGEFTEEDVPPRPRPTKDRQPELPFAEG